MTTTTLRQILDGIRDKHQKLTHSVVVQEATAPDHPLHDRFEWDDTKAGHLYRYRQAEALIRSVHLRVTVDDHTIVVPAYVRDPALGAHEPGYVSVLALRDDSNGAREAVQHECDAAIGHLERARAVATALQKVALFQRLVDSVQQARAMV